jgi:hypothetical protein
MDKRNKWKEEKELLDLLHRDDGGGDYDKRTDDFM